MPRNRMTTARRVLSRLPTGAADRRLAQMVYQRQRRPFVTESTLAGGATVRLDTADWPQAQAYLLGRYDVASVRFIVDHLPADGVFLDGGGHVGLISTQVAAARPGAQVHAFEPHPRIAPLYRRNASASANGSIRLTQAGLSDRPGELRFDVDVFAVDEHGTETVPMTTIDQYLADNEIERVDVLKLDIEGHELAALRGASSALESGAIRAVIVEAMDAHADTAAPEQLLLANGFERVELPDPRPWVLRSLRPWRPENTGFVRRA